MSADAPARSRMTVLKCWVPVGAMAVASFAVAFLSGCSSELPTADVYAQELFDGTNAERTAAGLEPLEWSDCLAREAVERAKMVAVMDAPLEHEELRATCTPGAMAGENLSRGMSTSQEIVDRWMDSAGHKANILDPGYVTGAVGCVDEGQGDGPMSCSWLAEGLSPDDPDYDPEAGGVVSEP